MQPLWSSHPQGYSAALLAQAIVHLPEYEDRFSPGEDITPMITAILDHLPELQRSRDTLLTSTWEALVTAHRGDTTSAGMVLMRMGDALAGQRNQLRRRVEDARELLGRWRGRDDVQHPPFLARLTQDVNVWLAFEDEPQPHDRLGTSCACGHPVTRVRGRFDEQQHDCVFCETVHDFEGVLRV